MTQKHVIQGPQARYHYLYMYVYKSQVSILGVHVHILCKLQTTQAFTQEIKRVHGLHKGEKKR